MRSVLFVCTANICRSPMAVGLFTRMIKLDQELWRVESAGVYAKPGFPAAQNTIKVLEQRGVTFSNHQSRLATPELLEEFQLILTMEKGHKEALKAAYPSLAGKIFLLTEIVGEYRDIVDPIGLSLVDYEDTAKEMESILWRGLSRICELTSISEVEDGG
jgi:protein-tyrosine-phosphatase